MESLASLIGIPFGAVMRILYGMFHNYGLAILFFTLLSKIVLIPVSVYVHKNGIKVVKMQPYINFIKAENYGDLDRIAQEQSALFKKEKYNPFMSLVPLFIQIALLMGLVEVINNPMTYIFQLPQEEITLLTNKTLDLLQQEHVSQINVLHTYKNALFTPTFQQMTAQFSSLKEAYAQFDAFNMTFLSLDLTSVPYKDLSIVFVPLLAGFSAWLLCYFQNKSNVLQREQGNLNKYGLMIFSVSISLYLGLFVPVGIAFYWILSNLFAIAQMYILNYFINPKKYVDYALLQESKEKLDALHAIGNDVPKEERKRRNKREKEDYKKFFSVVNKHIVFYSEKSGFYKYYQDIIESLLKRTNLTIHYVTSDIEDQIFDIALQNPHLKAYYIGEKKLITLFMKMDADMVIMTMPDLQTYHYKRSYVRKDIEYVYLFHYPLSTHMVLNCAALDAYDTICMVGDFQEEEIRKHEEIYHTKHKKLISCGYSQLEKLTEAYDTMEKTTHEKKHVLIAPSWQTDNILDTCIDDLLQALFTKDYLITVRPHPEYVKRFKGKMEDIVNRYKDKGHENLLFELDFSKNESIFTSDILITDWSGTAYEFAFSTLKPCIFVDTPPKINNKDYVKLGIEPLEFLLRDQVGARVKMQDVTNIDTQVEKLLLEAPLYRENILALREKYIANFGKSTKVITDYIIKSLKEKSVTKKNDG